MNKSFVVGSVALQVSSELGASIVAAAGGVSLIEQGSAACAKNMPIMFERGMRGEYMFPPTVPQRDKEVELEARDSTWGEVYEVFVAFMLTIGFSGYSTKDFAAFMDPNTGWRAPKGKKSEKVSKMLNEIGSMRQRVAPIWVKTTGEKPAKGSKLENAVNKAANKAAGKKGGKPKGKDDKAPLTPIEKMETSLRTALKIYQAQENPSEDLKELYDAIKQFMIDHDIATEVK